jgi:diguanylate cyclase
MARFARVCSGGSQVALLRSRAAARTAVLGLALGVAALAGLALWNTTNTALITARIRDFNQDSNHWTQFLLHVSEEYEALNDYTRARTDGGREPLVSAIGSASPALRALRGGVGPDDGPTVALVEQGYQTYTLTLEDLLRAGRAGQTDRVRLLADQATLSVATLRRSSIAQLTRIHQQQNDFVQTVRERNRRLLWAEASILGFDAVLLLLCALVLLSHQRRMERQAELSTHEALHDALTGIPNRVLFRDRLQMALREAPRTSETSALLLLDLDRFKEVNDSFGHHHGDLLLCEVARRMASVLREGDTVARLGGDEFGMLLRRVRSVADVLIVAERALEALRRPADLQGHRVTVGGSIGVAISPDHSQDGGELLRLADIAMYQAKRQRTGVVVYHPDSAVSSDRLVAAGELGEAIEAGQMEVHFQPKLRLRTGQIVGVEALVRWRHPTRGLLGPDTFIHLAEESDLILSLTDHVLDRSLSAHAGWREHGWDISVAVNVGVRSLLVHDLAERIDAALIKHQAEPSALILEITESAFITDISRAVDVLGRLRTLGVRIAIDDFGTGYSSMAYLQALPADELKIDRGFVGSLLGSRKSEAIVRATLELGHALGLDVTAEGVEDDAILAMLGQMGCDLAQGYHICRPKPLGELSEWLTQTRWDIARPAWPGPTAGAEPSAPRLA